MKSNWLVGSPPRVREKRCIYRLFWLRIGITPACAGKTRTDERALRDLRDHPRVCGKNKGISQLELAKMGSPPRVREKRVQCKADFQRYRITPACAGKTVTDYPTNSLNGDHPRVCGKNAREQSE